MEFGGTNSQRSRPTGFSGVKRDQRSTLSRRRAHIDICDSDAALKDAYPETLNFYTTPPSCSITLEEFEKYALERLKLLRTIERVNLSFEVRNGHEYFDAIRKELKPNEMPVYHILIENRVKEYTAEEFYMARRADHISHFLLRLAFARTEELRRWFIAMEVDFFRLKLYFVHGYKDFNSMLVKHDLPFEEATSEELKNFFPEIRDATFTASISDPAPSIQVFKVHFTYALDLVRSRHVFLHDGYAYVPRNELNTVVALKFRSYLSESLSILKKNIHLVEDDDRLRPLVEGFEKRHLGTDTSAPKSGDAVTAAQLSSFSQKSFPLCMKQLYDVVEKEHHLKHWGRLQLGLFFKGLGLPIEEATKYWRDNFTKRAEIDSSRFDKQYLYNIRHMYGKEGKRADYTPYSCMKVINSSVGPGDHHGCPFRHYDSTSLRTKFVEAGIPQEGIKEILPLVEAKHFQIACQRYFEWTHDKHTVDGGVNHPNQYFMESRNVLTGKKTIKTENKGEAPRTLYYKNGETSTQRSQIKSEQDMDSMDVSNGNNQTDEPMEDDDLDKIFEEINY